MWRQLGSSAYSRRALDYGRKPPLISTLFDGISHKLRFPQGPSIARCPQSSKLVAAALLRNVEPFLQDALPLGGALMEQRIGMIEMQKEDLVAVKIS